MVPHYNITPLNEYMEKNGTLQYIDLLEVIMYCTVEITHVKHCAFKSTLTVNNCTWAVHTVLVNACWKITT